jgi:Raf kinase inhibitor-like YbhB/YbcL family protein
MSIRLESSAFSEGGAIPRQYTCDGRDLSPPLSFSGLPPEAKSLALICDDPDAPSKTWVHWVLYNLPPGAKGLPEGVPAAKEVAGGGAQGTNDFRNIGYRGPCPPSGTHRYVFKLYALDGEVSLPPGTTKEELLRAMEGHVLAEGKLSGKYSRG